MRRVAIWMVVSALIACGASGAALGVATDGDSFHAQTELDTLTRMLDPLWQQAWPVRDWDALCKAGVDLAGLLPEIGKMKYTSHHAGKYQSYRAHRTALEQAIAQYRTAAGKRDTAQLAELFLRIKTESDSTIAAMQPIPFPVFDRFHHAVDRLVADRRDADDDSCLTAAMDSLREHLTVLERSPVPAELSDKSSLIGEELAYFRVLLQRVVAARAQGNRTEPRLLMVQLQTRLNNFVRLYLQ